MRINNPRPQVNDMLKETRVNLVRFSQMADTKANILLSIALVLLTISINKVTDPAFTLSMIVLIIFLIATILLSLLAVAPNFNIPKREKRSVTDADYSPLFFGDYVDIPYDEYTSHLEEVMNNPNRTYEAKIREIYNAGVYLHKTKYKYLTYGYILFLIGMIASTLIYFIHFFELFDF